MSKHIVVIGAGVIGLSSALLLQEHGYTVTIIARDLPAPFETIDPQAQINYTSPWGGAHNRWIPPNVTTGENAREYAFSQVTYARMSALDKSDHATSGITFMKGIEYLEAPPPDYISLTADRASELNMPGFRVLEPSEFPDDRVKWGCEYDTWCVNPMVYCCFLLRRFTIRGGRLRKRSLRAAAEVFSLPASELGFADDSTKIDAVVNATGIGFGDDLDVFVTRGQMCLVANACDATVTRQNADGSWSYCVPRGFDGGTAIGGNREPDNWAVRPSAEVRETILRNFAAAYPSILGKEGELSVIADIVGRRPTRKGGPRLEGEVVKGEGFVFHAYGLGGRGFELSWGAAQEVVEGVQQYLEERAV
ncbi:FAD dependent oxidoreductase [Lasiosphaeris hirsuta]|uniref:FAD dependent oxidoreductase n=1 Tax=Lasiosphaeris hirsuta TaxID=260670 RepID=A0AA40EAS4_9PEZI|nr:FAD dependent oxidoreductase [Lasiosphaeris hirsuta]